jgi:hypothetical protein
MIENKALDVRYLDSFTYDIKQGLADKAAEAFIDLHGRDAVPVVAQGELVQAQQEGHTNIVMVQPITRQLLQRSSSWHEPPPRIVRKSPREQLLEFYMANEAHFTPRMFDEWTDLLNKAEKWS